ncbi:methyltransferase domain-containing protein [Flavitalea sp.]|nr:methyltransferase domain-containing protein [Flavitalea sp.]
MRVVAYARYKFRLIRRFFFPKRIANYKLVKNFITDKHGIEIGGPSKIFNDIIKIYPIAQRVDGVNFSTDTIWEGSIKAGNPYTYAGLNLGSQYINDATDLSSVNTGQYDYLISSHCLEHVANPIKALKEWNRVIKDGGLMVLVLPNPEFTFDHKRKRTTFEHILGDYNNNTAEEDETHVQDVIDNCDLTRVYLLGGKGETIPYEQHVAYCKDNARLRTLHHHVYTDNVVHRMLETAGFKLVATEHFVPFHLIYIAHKYISP